jgi:hypothetical protein
VGAEGAPIEISWRWRKLLLTCLWGYGWLGAASERVIEGEVDVQGLVAECVAKNLPAELERQLLEEAVVCCCHMGC